jgi:hypothetical protein
MIEPTLAAFLDGSPCIGDLIHVANVLYLLSYLVRDILWLRILTVVAICCLMPYYFTCGDEPLWAAIGWNVVFTGVNLYQIFLLVKERWPRDLKGLERQLYDGPFHSLTPGEFVKLLKVGSWRDATPGEVLVEDGSVVEHMMVLAEGGADVRAKERVVATLEPGQFVGEMSFLTGDKAGADVVASQPTKVFSWQQRELESFLTKNGELSFKVRGVIGRDLVGKLRQHH